MLADSRITCGVHHFSFKSGASGETWHRIKVNPLVRYIRALGWTPIPLGIGFAYIAYQQLRHIKKRETSKITSKNPSDLLASDIEVSLYRMLPLRVASRWWGWANTIDLPVRIRVPLLNAFIHTYDCNVQEAVVEDLSQYRNLGEFFRRSLKPEVRPIHPGNCLVSPADGSVLHFGTIENGYIEQVKGITYSLESFLGSFKNGTEEPSEMSEKSYQDHLLSNKEENTLYHCVIYLAPGDYHKFHSPAEWTVQHRRHFPGELLSVSPGVVRWIGGLFNMNERVVYNGKWQHGFFSLTAVGATNVGSIKVYFDEKLETNKRKWAKGCCEDFTFCSGNSSGVPVQKGSPFGEFNLGSTIVLIFEAPKNIKFNVHSGQKIKYGELLSFCNTTESCRET